MESAGWSGPGDLVRGADDGNCISAGSNDFAALPSDSPHAHGQATLRNLRKQVA